MSIEIPEKKATCMGPGCERLVPPQLSFCADCDRKTVPRCNKRTRQGYLCDDEPGHGGSSCWSKLLRR